MISRYIFVCLYFISFFLINRWYDLYQYYFHFSTRSAFSHQIIPINQLNIKQLQYILNLRGVTYLNINEKYDLIKMVEQTGEYSLFNYLLLYDVRLILIIVVDKRKLYRVQKVQDII